MSFQEFLSVAVLKKMALLVVFSHSPILVDLGIIIIKIIQVHEITLNKCLASIRKLSHGNIGELRISDFLVHDWLDYKLFFLNVIRTWLKIDPFDLYFGIEPDFIDNKRVRFFPETLAFFSVELVSHF